MPGPERAADANAAAGAAPLARLDSFPYRHRVADVMNRPLVSASADMPLQAAARRMRQSGVSSLVAIDDAGRPTGLLTERDVLSAVAVGGPDTLAQPIEGLLRRPVQTVAADAFVYVALGRMSRLGFRHLAAVDGDGRVVGMVTQRGLLRLRAGSAIVIGDEIAAADTAAQLAHAHGALPDMAAKLLAEGVAAPDVAAVIAGVVRDLTGRSAELAEAAMVATGRGPAPAPWCVVVLGSAGRGESLLAPDQDNAIIHAGGDADDAWFAEAGRRLCDTLAQAGIPLCKGGVMAMNAEWRRTEAGWRAQVDEWIRRKEGESLLNIDIFFDLQPAHGQRALAEELRGHALAAASRAPLFLRLLADSLENMSSPLGLFGRIRTRQGRFDIKLHGLLPVVTAARVLALRHRIGATATANRLAELAAKGAIAAADAEQMIEAHRVMTGALLEQQIIDIAAGQAPGNLVEPRRLKPASHQRLKVALREVGLAAAIVRNDA
jgi:CBS domain-containing protein